MFSFLSTYLENFSCCLNYTDTRNKLPSNNISDKITYPIKDQDHNIKLQIKKI